VQEGSPAGNGQEVAPNGASIKTHQLAAALADIDPDTLNPRQALEALYRLRAMLDDQDPEP
jgi:hypothetical protein